MKNDNKIQINKKDYNRVLLTEVLPYEVPILLNNEGFYFKERNIFKNSKMVSTLFQEGMETYPFNYKIVKSQDNTRMLYLMHPSNQKDFVSFYEKYNSILCHLTQKSEFSLRTPAEIASWYYEKDSIINDNSLKDEDIDISSEDSVDKSFKYASSFFVYKKYAFLYKFYDSYEFHRIEKKFKKLIKFDISKCFDNISTKRLAEAIKDEIYAKENRLKNNFENTFSQLMEGANFGRNDGILIGPEISRIFAEVILQKIDRVVCDSNIELRKSYEVRRYVDDYFLFYNDDSIGDKIFKEFKNELENYKLYLNESKVEYSTAPFLTGTTMAKKDLQDIFSDLFDTFDNSRKNNSENNDEENEKSSYDEKITFIKFSKNPGLAANKLIRDIKSIVVQNKISFGHVTGYFFTTVKNKIYEIYKYSKDLDETQSDNILKFLKVVIDVSFFVYSMDMRVRSTFLISQISILCCRIAKKLPTPHKLEVIKKIQDEMIFIIKNPSQSLNSGVELINLLIVLSEVNDTVGIITSEEISLFLFRKKLNELDDANYFQIITILFYIKNDSKYNDIKNILKKIVISKLSNKKCTIYSESAHIFLDMLTCPYLDSLFKKILIKIFYKTVLDSTPTISEVKREYKLAAASDWFVDWSEDGIKIERLLNKKELKLPYE